MCIGFDVQLYAGGKETFGSANVTGECYAAIRAMDYAKKHGASEILICHDYEGIAKWATGEWKAKKGIAVMYVEYVQKYREAGLKLSFKKVIAHSGCSGNLIADCLADDGIEHFIKTGSSKPVIKDFGHNEFQDLLEKSHGEEYDGYSKEYEIFSRAMLDRKLSLREGQREFIVDRVTYTLLCEDCREDEQVAELYGRPDKYMRYTISRKGEEDEIVTFICEL